MLWALAGILFVVGIIFLRLAFKEHFAGGKSKQPKPAKLSFFSQAIMNNYNTLPKEFKKIDIRRALEALDKDFDWERYKDHLDIWHDMKYVSYDNTFYCQYKHSNCPATGPNGHWALIGSKVGQLINANREREKIMRDAENAGNMDYLQETLTSLQTEAKIATDINNYLKEQQ